MVSYIHHHTITFQSSCVSSDGKKADKEFTLTGRAISTDILDILRKVLLKYLAASFAISASLKPTKPIRRLGMTWESVTWKREKCFPRSSLDRVGGSPETNTLVFSILTSLLKIKTKAGADIKMREEMWKVKVRKIKARNNNFFLPSFKAVSRENHGALSRAGLAWYNRSDYVEPGEVPIEQNNLLLLPTLSFNSSVHISRHALQLHLRSTMATEKQDKLAGK